MRSHLIAALTALFCLIAAPAFAQCNGLFPPGTVCGNMGGSAAPPTPTALPTVDVASGGVVCNGSDQTVNLVALMNAYATTGATFVFHACTYLFNNSSGIVIPNDGASPRPFQASYRFTGSGYWQCGNGCSHAPVGGTIWDMRSTNPLGQFESLGAGNLELDHITFTTLAGVSTHNPFFLITQTTVNAHDFSCIGAAVAAFTVDTDCFVMGTGGGDIAGAHAANSGYMSSIRSWWANYIRRMIYGQPFFNGAYIVNGYMSSGSSSNFSGAKTVAVQAGGSGYQVNDTIILTGGTLEKGTILQVTGIGGGGSVTSAVIFEEGNYTATPSNPVSQGTTSGVGINATFNMTWYRNGAAIELDGMTYRPIIGAFPGQANVGHVIDFQCELNAYAFCVKVANGEGNQIRAMSSDGLVGNGSIAAVQYSRSSTYNNTWAGLGVPSTINMVQDLSATTINAAGSGDLFYCGGTNSLISDLQGDTNCLPLNNQLGNTLFSGRAYFGAVGSAMTIQPLAHVSIGATQFQLMNAAVDGSAINLTMTQQGNVNCTNTVNFCHLTGFNQFTEGTSVGQGLIFQETSIAVEDTTPVKHLVFMGCGATADSICFGSSSDIQINRAGPFMLASTASGTPFSGIFQSGVFQSSPPSTQTTNYIQGFNDSSIIFNGGGTITLTLLTASAKTGQWLYLRTIASQAVVSNSSNVIPLAGGSAGTAILAATAGKWAILQSDGSNWQIMAAN